MLIFTLFLISCKNNNISDNDIEYLNSKIEYYRISYQSTLYYENNELKEKNKGISRIEYFDSNNNILKEFTEIYGFSYNIYLYDDEGNQVGLKVFDEKGELFIEKILH